ncbi:uncharacterized protein LOC132284075 [Cornus florida]|uniref:uncharacterized protein LOC132284075 n=1 Tax=Cornus florida TaxID=4283 RepID=UPI00289CF9A1|nr:uncharacterized protein LOC132284075 [Cornus florida]
MGASQSSVQVLEDDEDVDEEEEDKEEEEEDDNEENETREVGDNHLVKKILEQEPEMLPYHASASPLSPQPSTIGTPRLGLGPSIKVWDPYNVLAPPPPPPPPPLTQLRSFSSDVIAIGDDDDDDRYRRVTAEVFFISHGDSHINLRPDLVSGRCPEAALTLNGKRQARALAVFLKSQGIRFNAVYTSPLDRAKSTAVSVCQEISFAEDQIQSSDALSEMSMGHWEGCHRSEIYTPEMLSLMERIQPDFSAPSGESLRQVEFRMVQFLNGTVLGLPERLRSDFLSPNESQGFTHHNSDALSNSIHDRDGPSPPPHHWDFLQRHRQGFTRKKSGKSRLQFVTTTEDHEADDEISSRDSKNHNSLPEINVRNSPSFVSAVGVFTHSVPIKCLLTGLLGCSPIMSHKICIDDSSVTVLQHSLKMGWQIKKMNDTAHLRLL